MSLLESVMPALVVMRQTRLFISNGDCEHAADVEMRFGEGVILACLEVSIDAGADEANCAVADIVAGVGVPVARFPSPRMIHWVECHQTRPENRPTSDQSASESPELSEPPSDDSSDALRHPLRPRLRLPRRLALRRPRR